MVALALALLSLAAGPVVDRLLLRAPAFERGIDLVVRVGVAVLLLGLLLPEAFAHAGMWAFGALVGGVGVGVALHRFEGRGRASTGVIIAALAGHALVDGAAIASDPDGHHGLAWAIVLHNVPTGVAIWRLTRARSGEQAAAMLLAGTGVATLVGFGVATSILGVLGHDGMPLFQSFVVGILLQPLLHIRRRRAEGASATSEES